MPAGDSILIVDDNDLERRMLAQALEREGYQVSLADRASAARRILETLRVSLVISDLQMPGESGTELIKHVRSEYPGVALLVVTADTTSWTATTLIGLGVHGYLVKPFGLEMLLVTVANTLRRHELEQERADYERRLEDAVRLRTAELERSREEMVRRLGLALAARDGATGRHSERAARYSWLIASRLGLDQHTCELIRAATPLHDIGKLAVPDRVLHKAGPLSRDERALVQTHTTTGYRMLAGSDQELLDLAATIALTHHERVDGCGYPNGLCGEEIPSAGRIVAVADVLEALTSDRPYRRALSWDAALEMIGSLRGTQLDPLMVDALCAALDDDDLVSMPSGAAA